MSAARRLMSSRSGWPLSGTRDLVIFFWSRNFIQAFYLWFEIFSFVCERYRKQYVQVSDVNREESSVVRSPVLLFKPWKKVFQFEYLEFSSHHQKQWKKFPFRYENYTRFWLVTEMVNWMLVCVSPLFVLVCNVLLLSIGMFEDAENLVC